MIAKTVKISEKGQIAIPQDIRNALDLGKGDELLIVQQDRRIVLEKIEDVVKDRFDDLRNASEKVAQRLWSNKYDEVWNDV